MSDWRTRKEVLHPEHPNYDEFYAYFNRRYALTNKELIPYGEPIEVPYRFIYNPRTPPIGFGYCQRCGEVMLVRDEQQKWCRSCRLFVKLDKMEARKKRRSSHKPDPAPDQSAARSDCEAEECGEDE